MLVTLSGTERVGNAGGIECPFSNGCNGKPRQYPGNHPTSLEPVYPVMLMAPLFVLKVNCASSST